MSSALIIVHQMRGEGLLVDVAREPHVRNLGMNLGFQDGEISQGQRCHNNHSARSRRGRSRDWP
jgi:hypothetical protein